MAVEEAGLRIGAFEFQAQALAGVQLITPQMFGDERGAFMMSYQRSPFFAAGVAEEFVQDNHSISSRGVLRGLHFQIPPRAQGKLVRVARGSALDVVVDIRRGSATFGKHLAIELSEKNRAMLWVPAGFAHGFLSLADDTVLLYKVTAEYAPECERGLRFDDPGIGVQWPLPGAMIRVNDRDRSFPLLSEQESPFQL